jgi:hypothetical protein
MSFTAIGVPDHPAAWLRTLRALTFISSDIPVESAGRALLELLWRLRPAPIATIRLDIRFKDASAWSVPSSQAPKLGCESQICALLQDPAYALLFAVDVDVTFAQGPEKDRRRQYVEDNVMDLLSPLEALGLLTTTLGYHGPS